MTERIDKVALVLIQEAEHCLSQFKGWLANSHVEGGCDREIEKYFTACLTICGLADADIRLSWETKERLNNIQSEAVKLHPSFTLWCTPISKPLIFNAVP